MCVHIYIYRYVNQMTFIYHSCSSKNTNRIFSNLHILCITSKSKFRSPKFQPPYFIILTSWSLRYVYQKDEREKAENVVTEFCFFCPLSKILPSASTVIFPSITFLFVHWEKMIWFLKPCSLVSVYKCFVGCNCPYIHNRIVSVSFPRLCQFLICFTHTSFP